MIGIIIVIRNCYLHHKKSKLYLISCLFKYDKPEKKLKYLDNDIVLEILYFVCKYNVRIGLKIACKIICIHDNLEVT